MKSIRIAPFSEWWRLLAHSLFSGSVIYLVLPLKGVSAKGMLIKGSVASVRRRNGAIFSVRVRLHAKCRLYDETSLPADAFVEICPSLIVGIDRNGVCLVS